LAYKVKTENFEGPFDLLLYLVSRKKVDIGAISISEIADQYLEEVMRMQALDLDVATDFLLVASTLLEIKAQSLLPKPTKEDDVDDDIAEMSPDQARDMLISQLITYKQFKNVSSWMDVRMSTVACMHPRTYGAPAEFTGLLPDFLEGVSIERLAILAAASFARREIVLLESSHIAAKPIPVEVMVRSLFRRLEKKHHIIFSDVIASDPAPESVVANFLALLELYKRNIIYLDQVETLGEIQIDFIEGSACPEFVGGADKDEVDYV
jgi:segregation and condensation protein A